MSTQPSMRTFRRHLALTAALVTLGFAVSAAALLFVPLFAQLGGAEFDQQTSGGIAAYILHLHQSFWPFALGAIGASIVSGMVLFERMRSPLVRFVQVYEEMAKGLASEPVRLRSTDYLHSEAEALNRLLRSLGERRDATLRELERLDQALREIAAHEQQAKSRAALDEASHAVECLRHCVSDGQ